MRKSKKVRRTTPESYSAYLAYRKYIAARSDFHTHDCSLDRSMAAYAIEQTPRNEASVDAAKRKRKAEVDKYIATKTTAKEAFLRAGMTSWSAAMSNFRQWEQALQTEAVRHPDAIRAGKLAAGAVRAAGGSEEDAQAAGRAAYHEERAKEDVQ
jgi:hypothetical protein